MTNVIEHQPEDKREKHTTSFPWGYTILGITLVLILVSYFLILVIVNADFVENQINKRLGEAFNDLYSIEIESIDYSLINRSFQASGITLTANENVLQQQQIENTLPSIRYEFNMTGFSLGGINLIELMRNDKIKMSSLSIDNPEISLIMDMDIQEEDNDQEEEFVSFHASLYEQLPNIDISELKINNATLSLTLLQNGQPREHQVQGINLTIDNIKVDSTTVRDQDRILFSDDVRLDINSYEGTSKDGVYQYRVGPISASTKDAYLRISDIEFEPTMTDEEFVNFMETRQSRDIFRTESITVQEIDYRRLFDNQDIIIGNINMDNFLFDTYSDLRLPKITPTELPHENVRELDIYLNIREINLNNGHINYAEHAKDGYRPGMITLEDTWGQVRNITNDIELNTTETPTLVQLNTMLAGQGVLNVNMELPLLAPDNPIYFYGKLERINAEAFNTILVDLEGVEITSGVIDSVTFDITAIDGHATGTVRSAYRDLEIQLLDREGYGQAFGEQVASLIANNLLLRSSDEEDEDNGTDLRDGEVDHELDRMEDSLLSFLTDSLINGLLSTMVRVL